MNLDFEVALTGFGKASRISPENSAAAVLLIAGEALRDSVWYYPNKNYRANQATGWN